MITKMNPKTEGSKAVNLNKEDVTIWNWNVPANEAALERDHFAFIKCDSQKEEEIDEWLWVSTSGKMIEIDCNGTPMRTHPKETKD